MVVVRMSECHPDRKHYAKGVCQLCYNRLPETKARLKNYEQSTKGKGRQKAFEQTPRRRGKKKVYNSSYNQSKKVKLWRSAYNRRYGLWENYGIMAEDYDKILLSQGGHCSFPKCRNEPKTRRLHVDHLHISGYSKMPPEEKRKYIRGLLCFRHNSYIVASNTLDTARDLVYYLEQYELRRTKCCGSF